MTTPSKVDIAMSMLEREALNIANSLTSKFLPQYANSPLIKVALEFGKMKYGDQIKAIVASTIESDASVDASGEMAKEALNKYVDGFQNRLKQRLAESEQDK